MANARLYHLPLAVLLLTGITAGCAAGDAPAARPPAENTQSAASQHNPVETALLNAAGVQYDAYAELLAMFSSQGTEPLLSRRVDLGVKDPKAAVAHYRRLVDLTDRMVAAEAAFQEAVKTMSDQTGLPIPGKVAKQPAVGWNLQLLSLLPIMQTGLLQSDLLHAGWKFWKWGENARRSARATVLGVAFADTEKHQLQKPEQEMMRRRVYEVARTRYADQGDLGGPEREFFENLRDGKLDHIAQRLHADMSQDGSTEGMAYMTVAGMQGKRPIDIVYEEGCRGLAAGVDLYVAAGKAAVAGGLGPEAGEKFLEGYDKAVEIVEKIQDIETHAEELTEAAGDPIGYAQKKVPQVLKERAVELLQEKTGLSDEVVEECTDQLGEAVQQVVQHVEVSQRIDAAYEREQFKAELAEAKNGQPPATNDLPQGEKSRDSTPDKPVAEGVRLRRITEQVHEEMAEEGWDLGAVKINLNMAGDAVSDATRSTLGGVVAWWDDALADATRLTIFPAPVASGTVVTLPADTQVELVELADSGAIHRLTSRPVKVSDDSITPVTIRPPEVETPRKDLVMGDRESPVPRPEVPGAPDSPPAPGGEEVLLSLPKNFDVVWDQEPWKEHPWTFRFRGEQVTMRTYFVKEYSGSDGQKNIHTYHIQVKGVFRRGVLTGQYTYYYTAGHFGGADAIGLYAKAWIWGPVSARADSDTTTKGLLKVVIDMRHHKHLARLTPKTSDESWGPWRDNTAMMEDPNQVASPWEPGKMEMVLQLPVGELQSSQELLPEETLPAIPRLP